MTREEFEIEVRAYGKEHDITLSTANYNGILFINHFDNVVSSFIDYLTEKDWEYIYIKFEEDFNDYILSRHNYVTRLEVIDGDGRSYVNMDVKEIEYSIQDEGSTLKIFIK